MEIGKLSNKYRIRHQKWSIWRLFWCQNLLYLRFLIESLDYVDKMLRTNNFFGHRPLFMYMTKNQQDQQTPNYWSPGYEFFKNWNEHKEGSRPENRIISDVQYISHFLNREQHWIILSQIFNFILFWGNVPSSWAIMLWTSPAFNVLPWSAKCYFPLGSINYIVNDPFCIGRWPQPCVFRN